MTRLKYFLLILIFPAIGATDPKLTSILQTYVKSGDVNYSNLCNDNRLGDYIAGLAKSDPDRFSSPKEKLAFWINAYNAYTLQVICDNYPVKSITELHSGGRILGSALKTTIWDKDFVIINNQKMTLNQIEHKILRPVYKDPRIHFALVCASKSCPALRPEAFEASRIEEQLDDQAKIFLEDPKRNQWDPTLRRAKLSKIFDWYMKDFGKNEQELLLYLSKFLPETIASSIQKSPTQWDVSYLDYDWALNEK